MANPTVTTGLGRRLLGAAFALAVMSAVAGETRAEGPRGTQAVFEHHLGAFAQGIDAILADYTDGSVLVTPDKTYRGLGEIRGFFQAFLAGATPAFWQSFRIETRQVDGDVAYLVWSAAPTVPRATDTLVVRDGKIAVQTFTPFGG